MDIDSTGKTAAKRKQNRLAPAKCRARKRSNRTPCCFNGREQYEPSKKPAIVRKIRAGGLIKTANTKNPNLILQNVIKGRRFMERSHLKLPLAVQLGCSMTSEQQKYCFLLAHIALRQDLFPQARMLTHLCLKLDSRPTL